MQRALLVPPEMDGATVQSVVHLVGRFTNSVAQGLVDAGCVRIAGRIVEDPVMRLRAGTRLMLAYDARTRYSPRPRPRRGEGYRVVFEDHDIIVVDKEAGLLSVPTPETDAPSLAARLFDDLNARGVKKPRLYAVHRLDRQVSGLLVFARSFESLWGLVPQFDSHVARRTYFGIAEGAIERRSGTLRSLLAMDPRSHAVRVARDPDEGRPAVTHWRALERFRDATACEITLETGRKNQIRVQFAEMGHPLVGDARYGHPSSLLRRVALHADHLEIEHPVRGGRVGFRSHPPREIIHLLHHLRAGGRLADGRLRPLPPEIEDDLARRDRAALVTPEEEAGAGGGAEEGSVREPAQRSKPRGTSWHAESPRPRRSKESILKGRWSGGVGGRRRRPAAKSDAQPPFDLERPAKMHGRPPRKGPSGTAERRAEGEAGERKKKGAPKAAWLKKREARLADPQIPEWVKRKMGYKRPRK